MNRSFNRLSQMSNTSTKHATKRPATVVPDSSPDIDACQGSPNKKQKLSSSNKTTNGIRKSSAKPSTDTPAEAVPWTYDDVKAMLERVECPTTGRPESYSQSLRKYNYDSLQFGSYDAHACKKMLESLIGSTRKQRTLHEIVTEIKENLKRKTYTNIIGQSALSDADKPKRPPTPYIMFHAERIMERRKQNPNLAIKDVSREISDEWKSMPEYRKSVYVNKHQALLKEYEQGMQKLGLMNTSAPKKPPSARVLYVESKVGKKDLDEEELVKARAKYGQKFDEMSATDKQKYISRHEKLLEEYKAELDEYVKKTPHLSHQKPKVERKKKVVIKPPEPPKTALRFFIDKKLEGLQPDQIDAAKKKYKEKFESLTEDKLAKYIKKAVQDKERYDEEVAVFKKEHPDFVIKNTKVNINEKQRSIYERVILKRPIPPAGTAYIQFCSEKLASLGQNEPYEPTKHMRAVSAEWQKFSPKDLEAANKKVIETIEAYIPKMEEWLAKQPAETVNRIQRLEPRAMPDYWKKALNRKKKSMTNPKQDTPEKKQQKRKIPVNPYSSSDYSSADEEKVPSKPSSPKKFKSTVQSSSSSSESDSDSSD